MERRAREFVPDPSTSVADSQGGEEDEQAAATCAVSTRTGAGSSSCTKMTRSPNQDVRLSTS